MRRVDNIGCIAEKSSPFDRDTANKDRVDSFRVIVTDFVPFIREGFLIGREAPFETIAPFIFRPLRFDFDRDPNDSIIGTPDADKLFGGNGNDDIFGLGGDDILDGGPGDDELFGGDGDDNLNGRSDDDEVYGGNGDDSLLGEEGDDTLFGEAGDDDLLGGGGDDRLFGDNLTGDGADDLRGGAGNDELYGFGGPDDLRGGSGDDMLFGGRGDDVFIQGGSGDDTLDGGPGNDDLSGGTGSDVLEGGSGDDILRGNALGNVADGEIDTLIGGTGSDIYFNTFSGEDQIVELPGQGAADTLVIIPAVGDAGDFVLPDVFENGSVDNRGFGFAGELADGSQVRLFGNDLDNDLGGGFGADVVFGGAGDDTIDAGTAADIIDGGPGNDTIFLADRLPLPEQPASEVPAQGKIVTGGVGADLFVLAQLTDSPSADPDRITDFEIGTDRIDLSALPDDYAFSPSPTPGNDILVEASGGDARVRVDAVAFAEDNQPINIILSGLAAQVDQFTAADFIV